MTAFSDSQCGAEANGKPDGEWKACLCHMLLAASHVEDRSNRRRTLMVTVVRGFV